MIGRETYRMKRSILHSLRGRMALLVLSCAALAAPHTRAADAPAGANQLQSISVQALSGNQTQLTLHMSAPAPEPLVFTIDKPARLSLDLPNTSLALPSNRIDVGTVGIDTVLAAQANGRTRVVLNLDQQLPYQTSVNGNDIVLLVGSGARSSKTSAPAASAGGSVAAAAGG